LGHLTRYLLKKSVSAFVFTLPKSVVRQVGNSPDVQGRRIIPFLGKNESILCRLQAVFTKLRPHSPKSRQNKKIKNPAKAGFSI
jgi:hypothetical protein